LSDGKADKLHCSIKQQKLEGLVLKHPVHQFSVQNSAQLPSLANFYFRVWPLFTSEFGRFLLPKLAGNWVIHQLGQADFS